MYQKTSRLSPFPQASSTLRSDSPGSQFKCPANQEYTASVCKKNLSSQNLKLTNLSVETLESLGHFFPSGRNVAAGEFQCKFTGKSREAQ